MTDITNVGKAVVGAAGGLLAYVFGPWDSLFFALVIAVVLDYLTGVAAAWREEELSSSAGFIGLLRKIMIFAIVALGVLVDGIMPELNGAVRIAVCTFYIANEGLSILENCGRLGIPIPDIIKKHLIKLQDDE